MKGVKMVSPWSLALELKVCSLYFSGSPHRKNNHSCLLGFWQNSVFIQPVIQCFYLRHRTRFESPNFSNSRTTPPGWGRVLLQFIRLLGPCSESNHWTIQQFTFYGNTEQKAGAWTHYFQSASLFECLELCCTQTSPFFLWPQGSWNQTVPPGAQPHFTP